MSAGTLAHARSAWSVGNGKIVQSANGEASPRLVATRAGESCAPTTRYARPLRAGLA